MRYIYLILLSLLLSAAAPKSEAEQAFDEWLIAFNANDADAMEAFSVKRLGYSDITYFLDIRDESGGLDLVKIERNQPHRFIATMLDRESKIPRRVTVELDSVGSGKLKKLTTRGMLTSQNDAIKALDSFAQRMADEDRFSGVLGIKQGQKLMYQKAFGMADRRKDIPILIETPFLFASQGKMFTAISIMQLVEARKLNLDDPIGKFLTDYPNKAMAKVTVRQLLTHTGGTGDIGLLGPGDSANRETVRNLEDIIKLNDNRPPDFDPGSRMDYSNYGFILLGAIIEKVSGKDYYDYVTERILKPAGMTMTSWPTLEELANVAVPYTTSNYKFLLSAIETLPWRGSPAGGGVSTVGDELRFIDALKAGKLLSLPLLEEATKPQEQWYGYGFVTGYAGDFPLWGHGGNASGTDTALTHFPTLDTTIACLANRDGVCNKLFQNFAQHITPAKPIED